MRLRDNRVLLVVAAFSLLAAAIGCDGRRDRGRSEEAIKRGPPQAIRDYIDFMLPVLRKGGCPDVSMEPVFTGGQWKIVIGGKVVSESEVGKEDSRKVLRGLIAVSECPAEVIWEVRYQLVPPKERP